MSDTSNTTQALPRWDLDVVYPGMESAEFAAGFAATLAEIEALVALFDAHAINRIETPPPLAEVVTVFETAVTRFNALLEEVSTLHAYVAGHIATNSRDMTALARYSEFQQRAAQLDLLGTRLVAWVGSLDVEALIAHSPLAQDHAFALRRAQKQALHLMSPAEEALAADLTLTGGNAWSNMFNVYTSQLMVEVDVEGERQKLPLPAAHNLSYHPDRDVRKGAYEAITAVLRDAAVPNSFALNSIKGETLALAKRRGWQSPLDMALFENAIDRPTLEAMMSATRDAFPDFQRYLKARARLLGLPVMAWYDRLAPLSAEGTPWGYDEATRFVIEQFATYSPKLSDMAERAFNEGWVDAGPRDGKRGGAFCMWLRQGESRILANYQASFGEVSTLAHELGHAYHNLNLADRTPLQRTLPMTLAETASTFCQKIVENAALKTANAQDQLIILDGLLEYATRVILGATSDFIFEQSLFERRQQRDLSADELCDLVRQAQTETFGDALDPEALYPYRWVYVPHYYVTSYYNYPYTFGLLFGLGLYARYQAEPDSFREQYDALLASTGMGEAADLAARFGIDIRQPAFWRASLDVLRADIDRFEALAPAG